MKSYRSDDGLETSILCVFYQVVLASDIDGIFHTYFPDSVCAGSWPMEQLSYPIQNKMWCLKKELCDPDKGISAECTDADAGWHHYRNRFLCSNFWGELAPECNVISKKPLSGCWILPGETGPEVKPATRRAAPARGCVHSLGLEIWSCRNTHVIAWLFPLLVSVEFMVHKV